MNRLSLVCAVVFTFFGLGFGQTFEMITTLDWSDYPDGTTTGVFGASASPWTASRPEADCDGTGFFGVQGGSFVVQDAEGTCGCPCVPADPSGLCGNNDNSILLPVTLVSQYCQVRVRFDLTTTGVLDCGPDVNDFQPICLSGLGADWAGADGLVMTITAASGDVDEIKICGSPTSTTFVSDILDVDPFDQIGIFITVGTQEIDESYNIGNIVFEGVRRQNIVLGTQVVTSLDGTIGDICDNSGLPILFNTVADPNTNTFQWTGPNGFNSTEASPRIDNPDGSNSGTYTVTVTETNTGCSLTETIDVNVLPDADANCIQSASFANLFQSQCSNATLPATDDNGEAGVWTPSADLSMFGDTALDFTFTPTSPGVGPFTILLSIQDINSLENFGTQPADLPTFCNADPTPVDLIDVFQLNLNVQLQANGVNEFSPFIQNGDLLNNFENDFRNISLLGINPGLKTFFIDGVSNCGTRQRTFQFLVVDAADPVRIDTALCEGDFIDTLGVRLFPGVDTAIVDGGLCDTVLIARVGLNNPGRMRTGRFFPGGFETGNCNINCPRPVYYFYDTIVNSRRGLFIEACFDDEPPLGPDFDTVFVQSTGGNVQYTLPFSAQNGCDSIVNVNFQIDVARLDTIPAIICADSMATVTSPEGNTATLSAANPFERLPIAGNCSFEEFIATILPLQEDTITTEITRIFKVGEDTLINGVLFNASNPSDLIRIDGGAANGCDQLIFVDLEFVEAQRETLNRRICPGDSVVVGDQVFITDVSGVEVILENQASNGGDSIVTVTVEVLVPEMRPITRTICPEGSTTFMGVTFDSSNTSALIPLPSAELACDSIIFEVEVQIFDADPLMLSGQVCQGDGQVIDFGFGLILSEDVPEGRAMTTTVDGCSQEVFAELSVIPTFDTTITETICDGDAFEFFGQMITRPGQTAEILTAQSGCDSTILLELTVLPVPFTSFADNTCSGLAYPFGAQVISEAGIYFDTLQAANGCDSIVELTLTIDSPEDIDSSASICSGDVFSFAGFMLERDTMLEVGIIDPNTGCDQNLRFTLDVMDPITEMITVNPTCADATTVTLGDSTYTESGTYTETFQTAMGCDSIVTVEFNLPDTIMSSLDTTICGGDALVLNGQSLTTAGINDVIYFASNGCDSIVRVDMNVIEPFFDTLDIVLCPGQTRNIFNNAIGNTSGREFTELDTIQIMSTSGCDSMITLNVVYVGVGPPVINETICEGDFFEVGTSMYTESGLYADTLINEFGCDSVVRLDLNVLSDLVVDDLQFEICAGDSVQVGSNFYSSNGNFTEQLVSTRGVCDSVINFAIAVVDIQTTALVETTCGTSFAVGNSVYEVSGLYSDTIISATGCDSIVNLDLTVIEPPVSDLDTSICFGQILMIGDRILDRSTTTQVIIPTAQCDSTINVNLVIRDEIMTTFDFELCDNQSVTIGDEVFDEAGSFMTVLSAASGCDSIIQFTISQKTIPETQFSQMICNGSSIDFGGQMIGTAGTYRDTISTAEGCDSIIVLDLMTVDQIETALSEQLCFGETTMFNGRTLDEAGTYVDTFTSVLGCDSLVTLTLAISPELIVTTQNVIGSCDNISNGSFSIASIAGSTGPYMIMGLPDVDMIDEVPFTFTGLAPGSYSIEIMDGNGCEAATQVEITDDRSNAVNISSVVINPGGQFQLNVIFDGVISDIQWSNVPGLSCTECPNPMVDISEETTYTVTVTDEEGCVSTASITLDVAGIGNTYIPNVFIPESTAGNDRFFISGDTQDIFYDLWIYDRWGNLLYSVEGARTNDRESGWNGRVGDSDVNPGVYAYTARVFSTFGTEEQMKGDVTLLR